MDEATCRTLDAVRRRLKHLRRRPELLPLARAYGVTLDELVDAPPTGNPRINMRPLPSRDGSVIVPLTRRPGGIRIARWLHEGRDAE